ncbi:MAG: aminopeptidase P N-terminal domain-containing protein, partial [Halioglobus sp.]
MSISKAEFARRRKNFMAHMEPNSIAIIPAAREQVRSRDTEYPFRQDSDFYYLCGFAEPEAVLVLLPGRRHGQFVVFCRDRDPTMEMWNGRRLGPEGVCEKHGADDAFPVTDIDDILPGLIEGRER